MAEYIKNGGKVWGFGVTLLANQMKRYTKKSRFGGSEQQVHHTQAIDPKHSGPIADYLGAATAPDDEYF